MSPLAKFVASRLPTLQQYDKDDRSMIENVKKPLVILVISCGLASCAGGDERSDEDASRAESGHADCIYEPTVRGYTVLDESNLIVEASHRRHYHIVLQRRARGLKSSRGIVFDAGTSRVCAGFDKVVFNGHMGGESIRIESIKELSPEDHEDILIQFGKKEPEIKQAPAAHDVQGAEVEELDPAADDSSGN